MFVLVVTGCVSKLVCVSLDAKHSLVYLYRYRESESLLIIIGVPANQTNGRLFLCAQEETIE